MQLQSKLRIPWGRISGKSRAAESEQEDEDEVFHHLAVSMQSRRTLTLTLSLFERERGTFGGTVSGSPSRDARQVRSSSPLPARSGGRIKVRGTSDCLLTDCL